MRRPAHLFALLGSPLLPALALPLAAGCGGNEPPPQAPASPGAASSAAPSWQPLDLSPVPEPASLVVSGRMTSLATSLATVHDWTKLPMPQSEQVTELLTSEAVGPIVDLDLPIDFAVSVTGSGMKLGHLAAASAAVKDPEKVKASLAERYKLVPQDNGVLLIQGLGKPVAKGDEDGDDNGNAAGEGAGHESARACELAPSYGVAPVRIVCGSSPKALAELGPWLTRSAPRSSERSDLHVDVRMKPLQPTIAEEKRFVGMVLGTVLGSKLGVSSVRDLAVAFGTDLADFAADMEGMTTDVTLGSGGAQAEFKLRLTGSTSAIGRLATSHPERTGPVPDTFWQLPADADFAAFSRGVDDAELAKGRDLVLRVVSDLLGEQGVKEADRKPIVDALGKLVTPSAGVYASGIDVEAVRRALGVEKSLAAKAETASPAPPAEREDAKRQAIESLLGWHVVEHDEPVAKALATMKELSAALDKPSVAAGYRDKLKDAIAPSLRVAPPARVAGLPAGTQHFVLELHTLERKAEPPPRHVAGKPAPPAKRPVGPSKPLLLHILVAGDAQHTWVAVGGDESVAAARLAQALGSGGEGLAGRSDLGALKSGNVGSGGFFTPRGLPEGAEQMGLLFNGATGDAMEAFEETMALPHQGTTPIVFTATAQPGGPPAVTVSRLAVPRDAIEDVVTLILKHGGF